MKLRFLTLWAINGALDEQKLQGQLQAMKQAGFDGTIFHPRYYPGTPPFMGEEYLQILSKTILFAKALGLEFWIYDENGWPSASANGRVLEQFPDSRCEWLVYRMGRLLRKTVSALTPLTAIKWRILSGRSTMVIAWGLHRKRLNT